MLRALILGYLFELSFVVFAIGTLVWGLMALGNPFWWWAAPLVVLVWFLWGRTYLRQEARRRKDDGGPDR